MKIKKTKIIKADGRYLVYYEEDKSVKKNKVPSLLKRESKGS